MVYRKTHGIGHDAVLCAFPVEVIDVGSQVNFKKRLRHVIEIVTAVGAVITIALAVVGFTAASGTVTIIIAKTAAGADVIVSGSAIYNDRVSIAEAVAALHRTISGPGASH